MKLVFATHNDHKLKEVQQLLPNSIELLSLHDIGCFDEIPETGATLEENAKIKADFVTQTYGFNCFSDDTGLLIDALDGRPGVFSARYAGEGKNAQDNMVKVLKEMKDQTDRNAHFKTVIHLNWNGEPYVFEGIVEGEITHTQYGEGGFGYDPIFKPLGYDSTFGELPPETKNVISHRGKAVEKLVAFLKNLSS
ncbi:non-canonical purine NTP diphosphatase [Flagellimonas aequoris]|uniref:dITP/XTP pyrophosphatase n=1 Tax=Flagellimonas aequoris TaxID=2306997 RepID=A0A418N3I1_9FLAO|nr:non-canonical purine NTP diphosphatase [Allomuricauda aequoris]RIV68447.1 non-canonical purine NTP diphosphatase [Allomuricauda aequoris]TXK00142.1 non-canonical purine NTP diphosphatase [Allomuricauda aequoris]